MFVPRIIFKGDIDWAAITLELGETSWSADAEYDGLVEAAWRERKAQAEREGHRLWDGTYYRLANAADWEAQSERQKFLLEKVSYRYIATYRTLHARHAQAGLPPLFHLSTAGLVRTRDGQTIFGKRSRGGAIDLIGGGVQCDELVVEQGGDFERNLLKEIREEVGIEVAAVASLRCLGMVMSQTSNILIISDVRTDLSSADAAACFARREEDEMAEPVFVPENELARFLGGMSDCRALIPALLV